MSVIARNTALDQMRLKTFQDFLEGRTALGNGLSGAGIFRLAAGGEEQGKRNDGEK